MEPEIPINSYHSVLEEAFIANLGQDKQQFLHLFANLLLIQTLFSISYLLLIRKFLSYKPRNLHRDPHGFFTMNLPDAHAHSWILGSNS